MSCENILFFLALVIVGLALLFAPVWLYLQYGWVSRRDEIMYILKHGAMEQYLIRFDKLKSGHKEGSSISPQERFKEIYDHDYGRNFFIIPLLLLFAVALTAIFLLVLTALHLVDYIKTSPLFDLPTPALTALVGAYMWVAIDFIARSQRRDFSAASVYMATLRLVIAIPVGYAFKSLAADAIGPFITFALGAFPLTTLTSALRRVANKKLGLEGTSAEETSDDIIKLQGVNAQIVERLNNEGITSITQIAYCDPVRVSIRTNLSFLFITDCMNQALAWMYFQEKLDNLRPLGLRGAIEIGNYVDALDADPSLAISKDENKRAHGAFPSFSKATGQGEQTLQIVLREIAGDPYAIFLRSIWE